ncbi:MAG: hypothetical protein R3E58_01610 [Phycisphaerae bacterium]
MDQTDAGAAATADATVSRATRSFCFSSPGVLLGYFVYSFGRVESRVVAEAAEPIESFRILTVPFYKEGLFLTPLLFMVVTVIVTTATSNSVNLTDGMDGDFRRRDVWR